MNTTNCLTTYSVDIIKQYTGNNIFFWENAGLGLEYKDPAAHSGPECHIFTLSYQDVTASLNLIQTLCEGLCMCTLGHVGPGRHSTTHSYCNWNVSHDKNQDNPKKNNPHAST